MPLILDEDLKKLSGKLKRSLWDQKLVWLTLLTLGSILFLAIHLVILDAIFDISPYIYKGWPTRSFIIVVVGVPIVISNFWLYRTFWDELMIFRWIR
jgi:ABC-type arginine/histidine transport system permease subunit